LPAFGKHTKSSALRRISYLLKTLFIVAFVLASEFFLQSHGTRASIFSDNFNRANGNLGGNWGYVANLQISNNQVIDTDTQSNLESALWGTQLTAYQNAQMDVISMVGNAGSLDLQRERHVSTLWAK
jgi:hypothetical protein